MLTRKVSKYEQLLGKAAAEKPSPSNALLKTNKSSIKNETPPKSKKAEAQASKKA